MTTDVTLRAQFGVRDLKAQLKFFAEPFGMGWKLHEAAQPMRAVIFVSRFGHCLNDLLFRWNSGALNIDIPVIVSNHPDLEPLATMYGIPFVVIPVTDTV